MTDVLAISLHSLQLDMARLERISMNIANATTPGYKREIASALQVGADSFAETVDRIAGMHGEPGADAPAFPAVLRIDTDARAGTLKSTGQGLDAALSGPGYFEIGTSAGPAYTRAGGWQLDARGRLVTARGDPVMGQGGEIVLTHPDPRIDATGQVFEAGSGAASDAAPVAQLKVVQFDRPDELRRTGDGLLVTEQSPAEVADSDRGVRQGFLENSNVDPMQEMVQLIRSMRHFESMQKVALGYDEMIGTAVRKLGELS